MCETYENCRILSVGIICNNKEYYTTFKDHTKFLTPESTNIHGLTSTDLETGKTFNDFCSDLEIIINDCTTFVSYNVEFDYNVMLHELYLNNKSNLLNKIKSMKQICVMKMYANLFPGGKWKKLSIAIQEITNEPISNAHNALEDIKNTLTVWKYCILQK